MDLFKFYGIFLSFFLLLLHISHTNSEALQLTSDNYQETLDKNKIVFINFYADWCMFSQQLAPIFHQAADIIHEEYPDVKFARVDCEKETQIALNNMISKYPTIKIFRNGKVLRKEYRGQRSVDAFSAYIKQQMKPSVQDITNIDDLKFDEKKNTLIAYLEGKNSEAYKTFAKIADEMRETTDFFAILGDASAKERNVGDNIVFKPKKSSGELETPYTGQLNNYDIMKQWADDKANPLVREITFENGEELTEEGLPFILLFHKPDDVTSKQRFRNAVMRELMEERGKVNFVTADGTTFSHPLHHLGKNIDDLPLICIDSFRHMYLFKRFEDIDVPGKIKQFVADLHSGKLHQDFHNPQPEQEQLGHQHGQPDNQQQQQQLGGNQDGGNQDGGNQDGGNQEQKQTKPESGSADGPPETVFNKLAPSENRYTLLHWRDYSGNYRDEL